MKKLLFFAIIFLIACSPQKQEETRIIETKEPHQFQVKQGMVKIPQGLFTMGATTDLADRDEFPLHEVQVSSFWMDETEVTNAQFKEFVDCTHYITVAERIPTWEQLKKSLPEGTPKPHDSIFVAGSLIFKYSPYRVPLNDYSLWWEWKPATSWQHPFGPKSDLFGKENHPVVHVTFEDAVAFANWNGKRLPTEAEWAWASRAGNTNPIYPWGNLLEINAPKANFFQGVFPVHNELIDGFEYSSPVKSFPPNEYGLYDMAGNVWEWCSDWYHVDYYAECKKSKLSNNPLGPKVSFDPEEPTTQKKVLRGGSFLCSEDYCTGYRVSRRMKADYMSSFIHTGFRCVKDSL